MSFNQAQKEAIAHKDGPMMVLAGPGSGKTTVITNRVRYLTEHYGIPPEEILVVTFTKAAAKEMKERYLQLVGAPASKVTFGTFHGIYYGILKWAYRLGPENIFSEEEKYRLLREIVSRMDMEIDDEKEFLSGIAGEIGVIKNNLLTIRQYESISCDSNRFREIFQAYENRRKALRKLDFDDMLVLCYELFIKRPDLCAAWQRKFRYILVDEFQDINKVQYEVLKLLALPENHLFIVGDDDQSIYRFRGARPEIMLGFAEDYPHVKRLVLDINYRSTKSIVKAAQRVISHNKKRYEKQMITCNEMGANVHVQEVKDPREESAYVVEELRAKRKEGVPYSKMAVLFRTMSEPRILVEALNEYNIPYRLKEELPNLYDHFIAKDVIAYLRMAMGGRERGDFLRIMNRPKRYIGRDSVEGRTVDFERIRTFYSDREWMMDRIDQLEVDLKILGRMAPYAGIQFLRKHVGYEEFLKEYAILRKMKQADLLEILEEIQEASKPYETVEAWFSHIEQYEESLKAQRLRYSEEKEAVSLHTMHGAKGLEYEAVYVIGANEEITPYKKACLPEEIEEERRMFYVAMTRAKTYLTVTYMKERNNKGMTRSRFVDELLGVEKKNRR